MARPSHRNDASMTVPIVLASTSRYRRELLERLGIPFRCAAPAVEETHLDGEAPPDRALRLACLKARAVAESCSGLIIGSDQVAALGERILDKPGDPEQAAAQLRASSGSAVSFHTAVCVLDTRGGDEHLHVDRTVVRFRTLDDATIDRYIQRDDPMDCAGSFKSEALGIALFEAVETTDPTALVGLPLIALSGILRRTGIPLP